MTVRINPIKFNTYPVTFAGKNSDAKKQDSKSQNPISRKGESMNLLKATFFGGLALGGRLLFELADCDFLFEHAGKAADKIVSKKHLKGNKELLCFLGATAAIIAAGVSAFALIYTMLNAPKISYKSKVNAFKKEKEMDVYINANETEKNIYTELANKAKNADEAEKDKLKEQYMKMQIAKNQPPEFVKIKTRA